MLAHHQAKMAEAMDSLLGQLGPEIEDPEEEAFLLFSQNIPSQNLGMIDPGATTIELTINGRDLTITQSPAVLTSNRAGGTTGAVVWKVTPLFASWLASPANNMLFRTGILSHSSIVLELGCGVSALVGLAVGPLVSRYVLSDQPYVARFVEQNLQENRKPPGSRTSSRKRKPSSPSTASGGTGTADIAFHPLDWELDTPAPALTGLDSTASFDVVLACDCIYNDALIQPFVQTCVDLCKLRSSDADVKERSSICVVAQQLRDPEVFEAWLKEFCSRGFRAWRVPDEELPGDLRSHAGFVVHIGILRD